MIKNTIAILMILNFGTPYFAGANQDAEKALENHFLNRCNRYSTDAITYDNLKEHIADFSGYLQLAFSSLGHDNRQFCSEHRPVLQGAMLAIARDMLPCLPKTEKYLPRFLNESFTEILEFMCRNNGKNIDNFFSTQGKQCLTILRQHNASVEIENCFGKIFAPLKNTVKKEELCEDLNVAKKCFSQTIEKHCENFVGFKNLNNQLFVAITKPCGSCAAQISSLFVILACLIISKIFS